MSFPAIDIDLVNLKLKNLTAGDRIRWVAETFDAGIVSTTSGGRTSRLLPHLIREVLGHSVPTIFVDTGFYPDTTYSTIADMMNDGIDVRFFGAGASPTLLNKLHGDIWQEEGEKFDLFLQYVKHRPLSHAFVELKARVWIRGIMGFQSVDRSGRNIVELKNGIYQVHPLIDWPSHEAESYMAEHGLPFNEKHFDLTKGRQFDRECGIDQIGFIDGAGI